MASENVLPVANDAPGDPQQIHEPDKNLVPGYPRLAGIMAVPQEAMFRRFATLNAQILCFMQAEITDLEHDLRKIERQHSQSTEGDRQFYCRDYSRLRNSADSDNDGHRQLLMDLKGKLKEYGESMHLQTLLAGMPGPSAYELEIIQLNLESTNNGVMALLGRDANVWGKSEASSEPHAADLVALRAQHGQDPFSKLVRGAGMKLFHSRGLCPPSGTLPGTDLSGKSVFPMLDVTMKITSVLASLLPVLAMAALYNIKTMSARLGTIAAFNSLFALCLHMSTNATRSEVFMANAAFSAVLVVFVNGSNCNNLPA